MLSLFPKPLLCPFFLLGTVWGGPSFRAAANVKTKPATLGLLEWATTMKQASKTINGMQNTNNTTPSASSERLYEMTGLWPGLHGADFLFTQQDVENRPRMMNEIITQWKEGAIISLMWHACNPRLDPAVSLSCEWKGWDDSVLTKLSEAEWIQLLTPGQKLHENLFAYFKIIGDHLEALQSQGVEVLFRPFHEMNQGKFWWANTTFMDGTKTLYRYIHDYMTHDRSLTNIVWVWDVQDFDSMPTDLVKFDPGPEYWDVLALDVYYGFDNWKYQALVSYAAKSSSSSGLPKPIALGEVRYLPWQEILEEQPLWTFFNAWSDMAFQSNPQDAFWNDYHQTMSLENLQEGWQSWM